MVKKIDPTKYVTPMPGRGADAHCDAIAASAKQADPIANSRPIHHETRSGRHQTPSRSPVRRLRCNRERQRTRLPSGARKSSLVTNGPGPSAATRSQPSGSSV
jgi:hypothetical protein